MIKAKTYKQLLHEAHATIEQMKKDAEVHKVAAEETIRHLQLHIKLRKPVVTSEMIHEAFRKVERDAIIWEHVSQEQVLKYQFMTEHLNAALDLQAVCNAPENQEYVWSTSESEEETDGFHGVDEECDHAQPTEEHARNLTFYTVQCSREGYPVRYIDAETHVAKTWKGPSDKGFSDPGEACREFEACIGGESSCYLSPGGFQGKVKAFRLLRKRAGQ